MYNIFQPRLTVLLASFAISVSSEPNLCYNSTDNCLKIDGDIACYSPKKESISGQQCIDWSLFSSHPYINAKGIIDFTGLNLTENNCGSYNGDTPWCFIELARNIKVSLWNYCYNHYCSYCDNSFYGPRDTTLSGHPCEDWKDHGKSYTSNYCLNPDNSPYGPWCYNTLGKRDYCYVPCETTGTNETSESAAVEQIQTEDICTGVFDPNTQCHDTINNCTMNTNGFGGCRDSRSQTLDGEECENWDSPNLETWQSEFLGQFPTTFLIENQCDTPDGDDRPWCFVRNTWQYCYEDCTDCRKGYYPRYQTISGNECDPWDSHPVDTRVPTGTKFPARLGSNGCYNPDNNAGGSWCFSTAESNGWDYCYNICPVKCTVPTLETGLKLYKQTVEGNADYRIEGQKIGLGSYTMEYLCSGGTQTESVDCEASGQLSVYSTFSAKC